MTRNGWASYFTWRSFLSTVFLSLLVLMAQIGFVQGTALAAPAQSAGKAAVQSSSANSADQAWLRSHSLPVKAATLQWAQEQASMPASPKISYGDWYCASSEHCYCPTDTPASAYYLCQWHAPFWPFNGMNPYSLWLHYWLDPNLPGNLQTWAKDGAANWSNSAANVYLSQGGTQSSADIEIDAWHPGANCAGIWGQTSITGSTTISHVKIVLNVDNYNACGNNGGALWISTSAHELGHAFGLEHNEWVDPSTGHHELMWSCAACNSSQQTPQTMDVRIINTMYPWNLYAPTLSTYCGSGWSKYTDLQAYSQSGQHDSGHNIPASLAALVTWHIAASSTYCHHANWQVHYSSGQSGYLHLWVPSNYAVVTTMTVTITSFHQGQGTWYNYVNINEAPYTGFYYLGYFPFATDVEVDDNQAGPSGYQLGVGPLQLT